MRQITFKDLFILEEDNKEYPILVIEYNLIDTIIQAFMKLEDEHFIIFAHNPMEGDCSKFEDTTITFFRLPVPIENHLSDENTLFRFLKDVLDEGIAKMQYHEILNLKDSKDLLYNYGKALWESECHNNRHGKRVSEEIFEWYQKRVPHYRVDSKNNAWYNHVIF